MNNETKPLGKVKTSKGYRLTLSADGYAALSDLAEQQGRPMANLIRSALAEYLKKHGVDVSLDVEHGGYRERRSEGRNSE